MNPSFALSPWELPPDCDAPLVAPADLVFRSLCGFGPDRAQRETKIRVRAVRYKEVFLHFFCDGEHPHNGDPRRDDEEPVVRCAEHRTF